MARLGHVDRLPSFARGVHRDGHKALAADQPIEILPPPTEVRLSLWQHAGAPARVMVKRRDEVVWGQMVGEPGGFVSASVHATVNGTVRRLAAVTMPNGRRAEAILLTPAGEQVTGQVLWDTLYGGEWDLEAELPEPADIAGATREAGVVGLGGAAFPTHVKLQRNPQKPVGTLLVNGCECEPYLTADYRLMLEAPRAILAGARLAAHAAGAERIVVVVEDNKPQAIATLRAAADEQFEILPVETRYPMGGERQLVPTATGHLMPTRGLPLDVGVVVVNVATAAALAVAVHRERPLTHRVVTVTGGGIVQPKNLFVAVGTPYCELLEAAGGLRDDAVRIIAGGPMMGFTIADLETPVTKGTSGLTILRREEVDPRPGTACIRCGRCYDVCPLNLVPTKLAIASRDRDWEMARRYHLMACQECGCCAFQCPAQLPLVQLIRMGKSLWPKE